MKTVENAELVAALESVLDIAHENTAQLLGEHMRELGTTTLKNKLTAETYVAELKTIQDARGALAKAKATGKP